MWPRPAGSRAQRPYRAIRLEFLQVPKATKLPLLHKPGVPPHAMSLDSWGLREAGGRERSSACPNSRGQSIETRAQRCRRYKNDSE